MAEIAIGLAIFGWVLNIASYFFGVRNERNKTKKENRRELILSYYPSLAENLRLSLPDIAYRYTQGHQEHGHYFEVLVDMSNDSTLSIIEGLDKKLHDDLKSIIDHFFSEEQLIDRKKDKTWENVPRKWKKWIEDNYDELPRLILNPEQSAELFFQNLSWALWRNDEKLFMQNFDRAFERNFVIEGDEDKFLKAKDWMFGEFMRIAEEEWGPIKDEYAKLHESLNILVKFEILTRMDDALRGLGE